MKPIKGLSDSTNIYDVPDGYVTMARNAINDYVESSIIKEKGFIPLDKLPYTYIGHIETPNKTFIFSTNNTYSAISLLENDILTNIIDDQYKVFKFGFKTTNPIIGTAIKNYRNEWIGTFIDELNPIRIINFDNPSVQVEADLSLFPIYRVPTIEFIVQDGGSVNKGTYFPFIRYIDDDFTYTDFISCGKPIYIGGDKTGISSKQINLTLTNLDTRYSYFELGFYHIQAGVTDALILDKKGIADVVKVTISNSSLLTTTGLEDLLVNSPFYIQGSAITKYRNRLAIGGGIEPEEINLQSIANNVIIKAKSTLVTELLKTSLNCKQTKTNPLLQSNYGDGNIKTFIHGETYAFYLVGVLDTGRRTRGFTIPGRESLVSDLAISKFDNCRKVYEIENTATIDNISLGTFKLGYWENQDENYPNKEEYNSLRNKRVRHHVMPSLAYCKEKLYNDNKEYGKTTLDVLGIIAENVIIPNELKGKIVAYEIYYAKRTLDNQRFLGQSLSLLGALKAEVTNDTTTPQLTTDKTLQSTGGNWNSFWGSTTNNIGSFNLAITQDTVRLHGFDLLQYKPVVQESAIINQIKLKTSLNILNDYLDLSDTISDRVIDYTLPKVEVYSVESKDYYRTLDEHNYLPSQAYTGAYDNRTLESTFIAKLNSKLSLFIPSLVRYSVGPDPIPYEETYLTNLIALKTNVYQSFYNQELIYTGISHTALNTNVMYCGDGFISDYSFVVYGLRESGDFNTKEGQRYIRRFICESNSNIALRYLDEGDIYSYFYPKKDGSFLKLLSRDINPNQWSYDQEWNKVYDVSRVLPYNPYDKIIVNHPNRIIFSAEEQKEKGLRSWRTFFPLDYVEIIKEKGIIVALDSQDQKLIILLEDTVLVSQGLQTVGNDSEIYLKTVDITEQMFSDVFDDNIGMIGSKQKFAFYKSPLGQVIVDQKQKNIYIYKDGLKKLNTSLNVFFKDNLNEQSVNPFIDKGYIISYDTQYDRLLFTQKGNVSFTLSYSLKSDNWTALHDYIPDNYIRQRGSLYNIKDSRLYKMNVGSYGKYHDDQVKPFYIDVPFTYRGDSGKLKKFVADNISWTTQTDKEFKTITHVMVYNPFQSTGRIALYQRNWYDFNYRKIEGEFWFDVIRDNLTIRGSKFITSLDTFKEVLNVFGGKEWFNTDRLEDKVVIIRLEDDNINNSDLVIQDVSLSITPSDR